MITSKTNYNLKKGHFSYSVDSLCEPNRGEKIVCSAISLKVNILRANCMTYLDFVYFSGVSASNFIQF